MTKLREVFQAIQALAVDGIATQAEIMRITGVSERNLRRLIGELIQMQIIQTHRTPNHYGASPRFHYRPSQKLPDSSWPPVEKLPDSMSPLDKKLPAKYWPVVETSGQDLAGSRPADGLMIHEHDMINQNDDMKEVLTLLNFIAGKNLTLCAERCTPERARQARALFDYCEENDAWAEYGVRDHKKRVGWLVRLLKNGSPIPPPRQMPLPAGAVDLTPAPPAPTDLDTVWLKTQTDLRGQMTEATYDTVIRDARLVRQNGHYLVIAPGEYAYGWMPRLAPVITRALAGVVGGPVEVKFKLMEPSERSA